MLNRPHTFCLALAAFLISAQALSQTENDSVAGGRADSATTASSPAPASRASDLRTLPEEVVITGELPAHQLREQIFDAQEQMYDIFNELNDDDRFDMSCSAASLTNSRISRRLCLPNFYREATKLEGQAYLDEYTTLLSGHAAPSGSVRGGHAPPALATIAKQQKEMQKKIEELARSSPEYQQAIIRYVELKERYAQSQGADSE